MTSSPDTRVEGQVRYHDEDMYAPEVDPVEVRRRIGMVFQKPNPFPKSIYDNVAFGPRLNGFKGNMDELVESSLRRAAIWDEVKDKLKQSGLSLSGGQQQRLCIARAIATEPEVILMDEPCSALDPRATLQIEELMAQLKQNYTIVIVTHNMQQAARASDRTAFMNMADDRAGYVVEQDETVTIFTNPSEPDDRGLRVWSVRLSTEERMTGPASRPGSERRTRRRRAARGGRKSAGAVAGACPSVTALDLAGAGDQGRRAAHGRARRGGHPARRTGAGRPRRRRSPSMSSRATAASTTPSARSPA